jgi:hypothetical protein
MTEPKLQIPALAAAELALAVRLRNIKRDAQNLVYPGDNMANIERRELGYCEDKARAYESYIAAVAEVRSKRHPLESAK